MRKMQQIEKVLSTAFYAANYAGIKEAFTQLALLARLIEALPVRQSMALNLVHLRNAHLGQIQMAADSAVGSCALKNNGKFLI